MAETANSSKTVSKALAGAIVGAIIIGECLAAYRYVPVGDSAVNTVAKKAVAPPAQVEQCEVDLGKFSLTTFDPNANVSLLIEFRLVGSVTPELPESDADGDADRQGVFGEGSKAVERVDGNTTTFAKLFKQDQDRFRDQVLVIVGNARISALTNPGLGAIRREILAKTNTLLGEPLLADVQFSDFAVIQQ